MTVSFASWKTLYLALKLNPAWTLTVTSNPWPTNGRLYLVNDNQTEWIDYTTVTPSWSNYILWWLTRDLDPTAIPSTSLSTWKTWLATQKVILVVMHDQLIDRNKATQLRQEALTFATTGARDSALWWNGVCTYAYTDVYVTGTGAFYRYNLSTAQWETVSTGTTPSNATTTSAWLVEIAAQTKVDNWTDTWWSGATVVISPSKLQQTFINNSQTILWQFHLFTEKTLLLDNDEFLIYDSLWTTKQKIKGNNIKFSSFGDGKDWDVTITTNITLNSDMYYNNLTINSPWVLNPNWYKIYVKNTLSWNWIIRRNWNNWWAWQLNSGWIWGVALNSGTLNADIWGSNWGYIGVWNSGTSVNPSYTNITWVSWWAWWTYWAWSWGTVVRWIYYNTYYPISKLLDLLNPASLTLNNTQYKWPAWSGWGWGWYSGWYWWWGWGWNWGIIWIASKVINFTWTMESLGWTWWNWFQWWFTGWSAWWGWGWQWWVIYLIASTFTSIWTQNLSGWAWWSAWNTWTPNWSAWANWNSWVTIQITI